jgi:hypothetical protein
VKPVKLDDVRVHMALTFHEILLRTDLAAAEADDIAASYVSSPASAAGRAKDAVCEADALLHALGLADED